LAVLALGGVARLRPVPVTRSRCAVPAAVVIVTWPPVGIPNPAALALPWSARTALPVVPVPAGRPPLVTLTAPRSSSRSAPSSSTATSTTTWRYYKQRYREEHHLSRCDPATIEDLNLAA